MEKKNGKLKKQSEKVGCVPTKDWQKLNLLEQTREEIYGR